MSCSSPRSYKIVSDGLLFGLSCLIMMASGKKKLTGFWIVSNLYNPFLSMKVGYITYDNNMRMAPQCLTPQTLFFQEDYIDIQT